MTRFSQLPKSVADHARFEHLGPTGVPALLAHPDWSAPAPVVLWMHGRTVSKELDPGRYARWLRAGIAVCAIDLPGHGERADNRPADPANSLALIEEAVAEIDHILAALRAFSHFDLDRIAIGGMSLGGMITLRRLCDPHPFICASVEATTGNLSALYNPDTPHRAWPVAHAPENILRVDASAHLDAWRPIPLQALHSEADEIVPWSVQKSFLSTLRMRYELASASPDLIESITWPQTGAPHEHIGFGRHSNDAKNAQTAFFGRWLGAHPAG